MNARVVAATNRDLRAAVEAGTFREDLYFRQRSVAERVLGRTKRPTLVVRSNDNGVGSVFGNILVAVDLSPASTSLIDVALQLSEGDAPQLTVVHAVETIEPRGAFRHRARWMVPEYRGYMLGEACRQLEAVMPQDTGTDVKPQILVAAGPAAETIGAHAGAVGTDLIVMGRSPRFLHLESTAVRILRTTDRALLVVPPTESAPTITAEHSNQQRAA